MIGNSYQTNIGGSGGTLNKPVISAISAKGKSKKGDIFNRLMLIIYIEWEIVDMPNEDDEND